MHLLITLPFHRAIYLTFRFNSSHHFIHTTIDIMIWGLNSFKQVEAKKKRTAEYCLQNITRTNVNWDPAKWIKIAVCAKCERSNEWVRERTQEPCKYEQKNGRAKKKLNEMHSFQRISFHISVCICSMCFMSFCCCSCVFFLFFQFHRLENYSIVSWNLFSC